MKVIFMGTPNFACSALKKLIADDYFEIVGVYTREPSISGRGHKINNSPIHKLSLEHNLKVFTPKTLKSPEIQEEFKNLNADTAVVVAYGLILPKEILKSTKIGCINIHPSILPRWRGAAPIQRTIMAGDKETGVNIIKMDEGVDSGDVIYGENFDLLENESYKELEEKLSELGAKILIKTLKNIDKGNYKLTKQDDSKAIYAHKLDKKECEIDWNLNVEEIERKIRGLNGSLGAYFMHNDEKIKIFESHIIDNSSKEYDSGKIINDQMHIQCKKGILQPLKLQRMGKKPLELKEFLLGFKIS